MASAAIAALSGPAAEQRKVEQLRTTIVAFLSQCRRPELMEPGEPAIAIRWSAAEAGECASKGEDACNLVLRAMGKWLCVEAMGEGGVLSRRVTAVRTATASRMELVTHKLGGKPGKLLLYDAFRPSNDGLARRGKRQVFGEQFRRMLQREYAGWRVAELSTEAHLEESLSPAYPRALLVRGQRRVAAIAAPPVSDVDGVLSFGLIWLDYVRRRDDARGVGRDDSRGAGLGGERGAGLGGERGTGRDDARDDARGAGLDGEWSAGRGGERGTGELAVFLPAGRHAVTCRRMLHLTGARFRAFCYDDAGLASEVDLQDCGNVESAIERPGEAAPRLEPESVVEAQVRCSITSLDASLLESPVHGQVCSFTAAERGVFDLLAVDDRGRLAVIELKASESVHLPLQALDYWIHVRHHQARGALAALFPGIALSAESPRLLLVAPALCHHPSNERVLAFFREEIEVQRIGLAHGWGGPVRVLFRHGRGGRSV